MMLAGDACANRSLSSMRDRPASSSLYIKRLQIDRSKPARTARSKGLGHVQGCVLANHVAADKDYAGAIAEVYGWFRKYVGHEAALSGVGHRVVHGGGIYFRPVMIDEQVIAGLEELVPLALA
jgi:acetate kinase